jgi:predicted nucleotide-binding protein (sugar kinase/HSP70/actin superfamily)
LAKWFEKKPSAAPTREADLAARKKLRVGLPKILNIWTTHQFWLGFFESLGLSPRNIVFSSDTSEEQMRQYGSGRGTVDCCYPVKCGAGHYGELVFGQKRKIDILFSPMIYSLASFLDGKVMDSIACPRVMAAPENIKAGFLREKDVFTENRIAYASPMVTFAEPKLVPRQLFEGLKDVIPGLTLEETTRAVEAGHGSFAAFNNEMRAQSRDILEWCAREDRSCVMVLARPYHMDSGIGHEIEADLQACGYPILWAQYFPTDPDLLNWIFRADLAEGLIKNPFDLDDVWPSSYSANTNEIVWGAKVAARVPWITCAIRLASYECGMDQPTFTPVQQIVEKSGTLFFSFQELDSTKAAGSVKIRVETISYYLERNSPGIIAAKKRHMDGLGPLLERKPADASA